MYNIIFMNFYENFYKDSMNNLFIHIKIQYYNYIYLIILFLKKNLTKFIKISYTNYIIFTQYFNNFIKNFINDLSKILVEIILKI